MPGSSGKRKPEGGPFPYLPFRPNPTPMLQYDPAHRGQSLRATADLGPLPDNVRTATFVPSSTLLPFAHVLITNGGYGGVQQALLHDLPVLVCGATEDKPEVARQVTSASVGLRLQTSSPVAIGQSTRRLLTDPILRAQVVRVGSAMRAHDAPQEAADAIERLLEHRRS